MKDSAKKRCGWAGSEGPLTGYHDEEWGVPVHNDRLLFEMLNLEGAQAGLNWLTILNKRENYRRAFDRFNPAKIARYDEVKRKTLLNDAGIVRNRLKVNAFIENAKAFLAVKGEFGSFDAYVWGFVGHRSVVNGSESMLLDLNKGMSNDMKKRGFRFVGPTTCLAFMQAVGMVNSHEKRCFRYDELAKLE